jgi:hypothetical protein
VSAAPGLTTSCFGTLCRAIVRSWNAGFHGEAPPAHVWNPIENHADAQVARLAGEAVVRPRSAMSICIESRREGARAQGEGHDRPAVLRLAMRWPATPLRPATGPQSRSNRRRRRWRCRRAGHATRRRSLAAVQCCRSTRNAAASESRPLGARGPRTRCRVPKPPRLHLEPAFANHVDGLDEIGPVGDCIARASRCLAAKHGGGAPTPALRRHTLSVTAALLAAGGARCGSAARPPRRRAP